MMRLQKYLAHAGLASRRKSEDYILQGRVAVNGQTITSLGTKVGPGDQVSFDGKPVKLQEEKVYYLLNKPAGYVTTSSDEKGRKTVLDLVPKGMRVYPVGRLDFNTTGLLILTNDGDFTYTMTHPSHEVEKCYRVTVQGRLEEKDLAPLKKGIRFHGESYAPAKFARVLPGKSQSQFDLTIHEGKNHQVKKMCQALGFSVKKLHRLSLASLDLKGLEIGQYRKLTPEEVKELKKDHA